MNTVSRSVYGKQRGVRSLAIALIVAAAAALAAFGNTVPPASADDPPPLLPLSPPSHAATFQVEAPGAAQYDEALTVQDFEPYASTYERRNGGMAFFSVVDGTVTLSKDGKDTAYGRGQSFRQDPGVFYSIGNKTNARARLITTTLTSPGSVAEANHPDAVRPAILPTTAFFGKATFNTLPARFSLNQLIIDFRPGAGSGAHSHPAGQGLVIVMAGEGRQRLLTGDVVQKVGDVFVDVPNRPVSHENAGSQTMTVVVSYVFAAGPPAALPASIPGVPPLVVAGAPAAAQPPAIQPPSTGDAGLLGHGDLPSGASGVQILPRTPD